MFSVILYFLTLVCCMYDVEVCNKQKYLHILYIIVYYIYIYIYNYIYTHMHQHQYFSWCSSTSKYLLSRLLHKRDGPSVDSRPSQRHGQIWGKVGSMDTAKRNHVDCQPHLHWLIKFLVQWPSTVFRWGNLAGG